MNAQMIPTIFVGDYFNQRTIYPLFSSVLNDSFVFLECDVNFINSHVYLVTNIPTQIKLNSLRFKIKTRGLNNFTQALIMNEQDLHCICYKEQVQNLPIWGCRHFNSLNR